MHGREKAIDTISVRRFQPHNTNPQIKKKLLLEFTM